MKNERQSSSDCFAVHIIRNRCFRINLQ